MRTAFFYSVRRTACAALPLLMGAMVLPAAPARADETLPAIEVGAEPAGCPMDTTTVGTAQTQAQSVLGASDTASLLSGVPGVALQTGGGLSSLPILHGMADDRNATLVDGVPLTSTCPNHMNPAMSYIAPGAVGQMRVIAGVAPVSAGGDSIGGVITVDPAKPMFAQAGETMATHGSVGTFYRSNNRDIGTNGDVTVATQALSLGYAGSWERARDGHDGNGDPILASKFESQSHNLTFAARNDAGELVVRAGHELTPYEGFPNARMDMLGNTSNYLNAGYQGVFGWGSLDTKVYWQNVKHFMDFLPGERNTTGHMPMNTDGTDLGYSVKAEIPLGKADLLRLGNEYHGYRLNDWWPPTSSTANGMMSPNTFLNINDGTRDVIGDFAELQHQWDARWSSQFGVRNDLVMMDTGDVQGYSNNMMARYGTDAAAFNAQQHAKTDSNWSLVATTRYDASALNSDEIGLARKSESPNLYQRYAWSTGGMAASMVGWFGNGTEYVGNLNLKPETANTLSTSTEWHDAARADWDIKLTPYYTYVENYINVNSLGSNGSTTPGVLLLQFANHDAQMFGFDLSGKKQLARGTAFGDFDSTGTAGLVKGMQINNGNSLYHMQPLNADLALNQHLGNWRNSLSLRLVDNKSVTNPLENEQITPGFAILNWATTYQLGNITFAAGIDNILDKQYYDPDGGAYVSWWRATNTSQAMGALPSPGRSYNAGVKVAF